MTPSQIQDASRLLEQLEVLKSLRNKVYDNKFDEICFKKYCRSGSEDIKVSLKEVGPQAITMVLDEVRKSYIQNLKDMGVEVENA